MGLEKNTAGKWVVFAYGAPDHASAGLAITGDAANITANVRIDGGAVNAVDDTNPTELEDGFYVFDITAAEANGDVILICPVSSTSDVIVIGAPAVAHTVPANFNALGIESGGDVTKVNTLHGHTAQTGDAYALANGSAGFVAIDTVVDAILADTGTTLPATLAGLNDFDPASDTVANVTLVATTTTNTDMRGTDSANTTVPDAAGTAAALHTTTDAAIAVVDGVADAILVDTGTTLPATLTTIDGVVDAILVDTGTTLPSTLSGIETKVDTVDGVADAILVDTGTTLPATLATIDTVVDAILIDTGTTLPAAIPSVSDIWTTALTEAYRSTGATGTAAQLMYELIAHLGEHANSGTTRTLKKLDGSTTAKTYTYDDATSPTSITEAT
jgi:hypothetical protein